MPRPLDQVHRSVRIAKNFLAILMVWERSVVRSLRELCRQVSAARFVAGPDKQEEEQFILYYRTSEGATELVTFQVLARSSVAFIQEQVGIKSVIAKKVKSAAMELVGA